MEAAPVSSFDATGDQIWLVWTDGRLDCAGELGAVSEKCGATSGAALGLGGVDDLGTAPSEYITARSPSGSDIAGMFVLGTCDAGALGAVENANGTLGEAGGPDPLEA